MKNLRLTLIACTVGALATFLWGPRGGAATDKAATTDKAAATATPSPSACPQWEVMTAQATRVTIDVRALPEMGKPIVEAAPAGWEPFAFTPQGQMVYRRCAK